MPYRNRGSYQNYTPAIDARVRYKDIDCNYCVNYKNCPYLICPRIMDDLDDLMIDRAFVKAIKRAGSCKNRHKETLIMLKEDRGYDLYC